MSQIGSSYDAPLLLFSERLASRLSCGYKTKRCSFGSGQKENDSSDTR